MATPQQIAANQANSQKSTGPQTEAGKAASSQNAVKHGLRSKDFVVAPEDKAEFEELRDELREQVDPDGGVSDFLFEQLLEAAWNQRRCRRAEVALRNELGRDPMQDPIGLKRLATLDRYSRRAERAFHRAYKELVRLQSESYFRTVSENSNENLDLSGWGIADIKGAESAYIRQNNSKMWAVAKRMRADLDMRGEQLKQLISVHNLAQQNLAQTNPNTAQAAA